MAPAPEGPDSGTHAGVTGAPADPPDLGALSAWAPELAKTFASLASDIALVIDGSGVIRNVAQGGAQPLAPAAYAWVGRPWIDTVSGDTRTKIENLLNEVAATGIARRREVNHPLSPGSSIPVAYTAVRLGANGPVLAVGRDLRAIAAIQQRYVESQQEMERGYWQARQAEARYQLLFQVATDAVMVVDAQSLQIVEANHSAAQLFDIAAEHLQGRQVSFGFERFSRGPVTELMISARTTGQPAEIRARLHGKTLTTRVAATPFRAGEAQRLLVRVRAVDTAATSSALNTTLARLVDDASDGVVVTDSNGRILVANPTFLAMVRLAVESEVTGQPLMSWLDLDDQSLASFVPRVRREGMARRIRSWIKPADRPALKVEISAVLLTEGDQECIGFTIHPVAPARDDAGGSQHRDGVSVLVAGIEHLVGRLGDLSLPAMLQATSLLAEARFVELALQRTDGDTEAASRLLGISPEALSRIQRRNPAAAERPDRDPSADAP